MTPKNDIYFCDFLDKIDSHQWLLIKPLDFRTRYGEFAIPSGVITDLYSVVPDTRYPDFWKASILHDELCKAIRRNDKHRLCKYKVQADICFKDEMLVQSAIIFSKLQEQMGTEIAVEEFEKLIRLSRLYYRGVTGILGRLYEIFVA